MAATSRLLRIARQTEPGATDCDLLRRYVEERDEAAFAEIVRRTGPLVLRACRSVLDEATAAEDAFQATFLVLARKASRLTHLGSLAGWLHATAVQIAQTARRTEARTRRRESARAASHPTSPDDLTWREVREVLDTELAALPEKLRLPLVLCYLQELSYEEAARRAGCSVGALRGRLDRGKERLRKRLARYGLPLAAPALVIGPPSPVSAALVESTLHTLRTVAGGDQVPVALAGLVGPQTSLRAALLVTATLAAVGVVLAGVGRPAANSPEADTPRPVTLAAADEPAPRTDRFGDPLPEGVLARLGTVRSRAGIHSFGFLADGTVVTVGPALDVRTWSPKSDAPGDPVALPLADPDRYLDPQVSLDGRFVAAGNQAKLVVWERSAPLKQVAAFEIKDAQRFALSPDGSQLAVTYERVRAKDVGRIALCDVRTGTVRELEPAGSPDLLRFSGDGRRLMAGLPQRAIIWDTQAGKMLADHKGGNLGNHPCALDRTGGVIAVLPYAWGKDRVQFLDATTGKPVEGWTGPQVSGDRFLSFALDGKTVLIGSHNGVRWWDPAAGKLIRQFDAPASNAVGAVRPQARLSPDGKVLVSHTQQALFRWDAMTGKPLFPESQETGHTEAVAALGVSPDGTRIATVGWEVGARVWDAATGRQLAVLPSSTRNQTNLDFSPDGRFLFAPSRNCDAVVKWDLATGKEVARYATGADEPWGGSLHAFRLAPDGRAVHAVTRPAEARGSKVVTWDAESGRVLSERPIAGSDGPGAGVTGFSPDGCWCVGGGLLFPVAAGPEANVLAGAQVRSFGAGEFSWDSRLIALTTSTGPPDRTCHAVVLEVATGAKVCQMPVRWATQFAFHPDGRSLAGAESDGLVFWDLTTGKEYARRKAHAPHLDDPLPFARVVRYFPDGKKLVTGHIDTTALVWEAPARPKAPKAFDDKGRAAAWDNLTSLDGAKGWGAVWALADDPAASTFLRGKVKPVEALPAKEFDQLLADLGSEVPATRDAATEKLGKARESAAGQLRAALKGELSAEQKLRVERLLAGWTGADWKPPTGERLRVVRAVAALELAGTTDARKLLAELARGAVDATTTREAKLALERTSR